MTSWRLVVTLLAGVIFGSGLALSGMLDPARVLGFLDLASGHWDASLLFVLGGALLVALPAVQLQRRLTRPLLDTRFHLPPMAPIDRRLLLGAALFGLGWGLAGLCPGPALAALGLGIAKIYGFVAALVAGMMLHDRGLAGRETAAPKA
ncbi:MAG: YeeE/YedE family protein [Pseudomonas oryzihabitans]|uniref:YeeE/YedE family protein n=1 Tax=Pseudomonas oryzihabitans TaxID=47885 RepID=UPI0029137F89|nr:YeeE/YedE family protein [Pseudomonas oryzihabitans]MDU4055383.1 YeeE/YedE family protein [Pseudomonas oryzihabitans]